jgi:hypothetical protein
MSRKGEHGNLDLGVIKKQDIEPENALNQQISQYQFFLDLTKRLDKDFYPVNGAKIISNEEKPWAAIRLLDQIFEPISHICYRLTWNTIQTISISNIGNKTVATFRETEYMWALLFDTSSSFTFFSASGNRSISFPEWEQNNNLLAENIESAQNNPWFNITTRRVTSEPYYIPSSGGMTQGSSGHHVSSEIISTYSNSPK